MQVSTHLPNPSQGRVHQCPLRFTEWVRIPTMENVLLKPTNPYHQYSFLRSPWSISSFVKSPYCQLIYPVHLTAYWNITLSYVLSRQCKIQKLALQLHHETVKEIALQSFIKCLGAIIEFQPVSQNYTISLGVFECTESWEFLPVSR